MHQAKHSTFRQSGFTIVELMAVVIVVAISVTLAMPSFIDAIERNRITSQTNELIAALNFSRTEAIRSNAVVGVCGLNAAKTGCDATNWNRGWLVYRPADNTVLRVYELSPKDQLTGTADVRFGARGQLVLPAGAAASLSMQPQNCRTGKPNVRGFTVSVTGASSHSKANCT